jgi:hypothetical protein
MEHQKRSVVQLISLSHRKHPSKHKSLQPMAFGSGDPFLADEGGNMYGFLPSPVCLRTSIWSELGRARWETWAPQRHRAHGPLLLPVVLASSLRKASPLLSLPSNMSSTSRDFSRSSSVSTTTPHPLLDLDGLVVLALVALLFIVLATDSSDDEDIIDTSRARCR